MESKLEASLCEKVIWRSRNLSHCSDIESVVWAGTLVVVLPIIKYPSLLIFV